MRWGGTAQGMVGYYSCMLTVADRTQSEQSEERERENCEALTQDGVRPGRVQVVQDDRPPCLRGGHQRAVAPPCVAVLVRVAALQQVARGDVPEQWEHHWRVAPPELTQELHR